MTDLTAKTPTEVDTALASLFVENQRADRAVVRAVGAIHGALGERQRVVRYGRATRYVWPTSDADAVAAARAKDAGEYVLTYGKRFGEMVTAYDTAVAAVAALADEIARHDAEWVRRGRWSRFFVVQNHNGHVHSSMNCSTCNRNGVATDFGWNPDLSGLSEADAVAKLGPTLCTVCFPSAPVEWTVGRVRKTRDEIAAEKAAAAAKARVEDVKLIAAPDGGELRVDGATLRTVRSAEIAYVDHLVWAAYGIGVGEANESYATEHEAHAAKIAAALAAKYGTTAADEVARLADKVAKKIRKEFGAEVAARWAARLAAQATAAAPAAERVDEDQVDEDQVDEDQADAEEGVDIDEADAVVDDYLARRAARRAGVPAEAIDFGRVGEWAAGLRVSSYAMQPERQHQAAGQAPATLDAGEDRAAAAGRVFARTQRVDVVDGDTRYRMRRARVGQRVVEVYDAAGKLAGAVSEDAAGWLVTPAGGAQVGPVGSFAAAVAALRYPYQEAPAPVVVDVLALVRAYGDARGTAAAGQAQGLADSAQASTRAAMLLAEIRRALPHPA